MPEGLVLQCGSCECSDLVPVLDLGDQPLPQVQPGRDTSKTYSLRLVQCQRCFLVQLDYIVPQSEVFPTDYAYTTGNTKALRDHFRQQAQLVAGIVSPGDLVIDIGGNDGTMLRALRNEATKARLLLVEPTDQARKSSPGVVVEQTYFTAELARKMKSQHGPATVITASNVFAHVPDPHDFLNGVNTLLADAGTFIIDNQDWAGVVNGLLIDTIYHEHLRYYSPASLSWLLQQHGLLVSSLNPIAMHGGAFRAIVIRQQPDLEKRADQLVSKLTGILDEAKRSGPIYGVGAPTRATPLINYAGLGRYLTCVCEVPASEKIGGTVPGTTVPVVDESVLIRDQPPHALLLAWPLADTVIPALRRAGYAGRFITPLPEPRFVDG